MRVVQPPQDPYHLPTIHMFSLEALGDVFDFNIVPYNTGSYVWPEANMAIYIPFILYRSITAKIMGVVNGSPVSGNVDVGIYSKDGTRLVSSGSTAQAGTSTLQPFDIPDIPLGPGSFYMAIAVDNTIGKVYGRSTGHLLSFAAVGMAAQSAAFPLPLSATFATVTKTYIPYICLSTNVVL